MAFFSLSNFLETLSTKKNDTKITPHEKSQKINVLSAMFGDFLASARLGVGDYTWTKYIFNSPQNPSWQQGKHVPYQPSSDAPKWNRNAGLSGTET